MNEPDLIQRILKGDLNHFHELIRPYERRAFLIAFSILRNHDDAEDAVQQAMAKIFQHMAQLAEVDKFCQWAMRIVENEARMYRRKRHEHLFQPLNAESDENVHPKHFHPRDFADWRHLPSEVLEQGELRNTIMDAVTSLPEIYREIFVLRDMEHLSMAQVAEILDISIPAIKTRLHRARLLMRERLAPAFAKPRVATWARWKGVNPWFAAKR